jgi:hypothetical protein
MRGAVSDVTEWITNALNAAGGRLDVVELPTADAATVVKRARSTFVDGNPSAWWLGLKLPASHVEVPEGPDFVYLRAAWPPGHARAFFIPEDDADTYRVFDASVDGVIGLLSESPFFEYYIVAKDFRWLLAEDHHDRLWTCRDTL